MRSGVRSGMASEAAGMLGALLDFLDDIYGIPHLLNPSPHRRRQPCLLGRGAAWVDRGGGGGVPLREQGFVLRHSWASTFHRVGGANLMLQCEAELAMSG